MKILKKIYSKIKSSFKKYETECGGLLGKKNSIICEFLFDSGTNDIAEYRPNVDLFNKTLIEWAENNIDFAGIIHSHPNDCRFLSYEDELTIEKICSATSCDHTLYFPIFTLCDEEAIITVYKYEHGIFEKEEMEII